MRVVAADDPILPATPALGGGWHADWAVLIGGLAIMDLRHDNGEVAAWFFDQDGRHSSTIDAWTEEARATVRDACRPAVLALVSALLPTVGPGFEVCEPLSDFVRLGPGLRRAFASSLQTMVLPDPVEIELESGSDAPGWADGEALLRALSVDLQPHMTAAMCDGVLTWPSPTGGAAMVCTGCFALDDLNGLLRFRDGSGLDVLVLVTEHLSRVAGLYVPAHEVVVMRRGDQARILRQHFPGLGRIVLDHLAHYADSLLGRRAPTGFATFLRGGGSAHLGHQLWNELTAVDALVAELPPERLPLWLVPGGPGTEIEFYGALDVLYPEVAGRVRRGFADQRAVIRHAYDQGLILFRATRDRVGAGLRARVVAEAGRRAPSLPAARHPVLVGLRVENRTATDLLGLCALVVEEAMRLHPGCTVVFDGHNARGGTRSDEVIGSYREAVAAQTPLAVERALVDGLRVRFAGQPVALVDTLGEPLAVSLAWAQACRGFVTLWGAGLAKYRWVANKPGLVVSSRWNLENKGDLNIYDSDAFMEGPTPVVFTPGHLIRDLPDAPMLVPFDVASYWNFEFDVEGMRGLIRDVLAALDGPAAGLQAIARRSRRLMGSVDGVGTEVHGWAIASGEEPIVVEIVVDGAVIGRVRCDMPRPDLLAAGLGTAAAGFGFTIPDSLLDGAPHDLVVRYDNGDCLPLLSPNAGDPFVFRLGHSA